MMYAIAVMNQKGGVGKTATTINLGAALTEAGYRVLLVDLDPQGHLTEACDLAETTEPATLAQAMLGRWTGDPRQLPASYRPGLDAIATNVDAFLLERALYQERAMEQRLSRVLDQLAEGPWEVCLIDCPPSLGVLTDNALVAAGRALLPVQAEDSTLRALRLLIEQVSSLQTALKTEVDMLGIVVNSYDRRRGQVVTSTLETLHGYQDLPVLAVIPDRAAVREAWRVGAPVLEHAPDSDVAEAYRKLAANLMETAR